MILHPELTEYGFLRVVSPERQRTEEILPTGLNKKERKEVVIIKKMLTSFKRELTLKEINLHINEKYSRLSQAEKTGMVFS